MRYSKHIGIFTIVVSVLLTSCGSAKETLIHHPESSPKVVAVEFSTIVKGELNGAGEEGLAQSMIIIRNQEEWEALKGKMNTVNNETDAFETSEMVDFNKEIMIACFDKVRTTGGYNLFVDEVTESIDTVNVIVQLAIPVDMATSVMTQPYVIIKLRKTNKTIAETRW